MDWERQAFLMARDELGLNWLLSDMAYPVAVSPTLGGVHD